MELSEYVVFSDINVQLGDEKFDTSNYWGDLLEQHVCTSYPSKNVYLKNISTAFDYEWKLKTIPRNTTGYVESGMNEIPSMTLTNASTEVDTLGYEISFKRDGDVYYKTTCTFAVLPSDISFVDLMPQNESSVDSPSVQFSWGNNWWTDYAFEFYIWEVGKEEPVTPYGGYGGNGLYLSGFCKENKKYNWKIVVLTECARLTSKTQTFSVSENADLEVSSVSVPSVTLLSGQRTQIKALITNRGKKVTTASNWMDQLFISKDTVLDEYTDRLLGAYSRNGSLPGGEQYEAIFDVGIPRLDGANYFLVKTDIHHSVSEEFDRENNIGHSDEITILLADLEKVENLIPVNKELFSSTAITFSWKGSLKAKTYSLYLWEDGTPEPSTPLVSGLREFRYVNNSFCQFDESYLWKVAGYDESGEIICQSTQNAFLIKSAPDLHVTEIKCGEAWAGKKVAVSWIVKNDGKEGTGDVAWSDYVWLVPDISEGISSYYPQSMANIKALSAGDSYTNNIELAINERISGDYYVVVATDMSHISSIDWSPVNGVIPNPYTPNIQGTPYPYLKGGFWGKGNVIEAGELGGQSDNFFYKKIKIQLPDLPDLQVLSVVPPQHSLSGQDVAVVATIANKGEADTPINNWYDEIFISMEQTFNEATAQSLGSVYHTGVLAKGAQYTTTFNVRIPVRYSGTCYFFVKTDKYDRVYEHANSGNNTTVSENSIDVIASPTADMKLLSLDIPATGSNGSSVLIKGKAKNIGLVETDSHYWNDYVYVSQKADGLDGTAERIGVIGHYGQLKRDQEYDIEGLCSLEKITEGNYYVYVKINADNGVSETEETLVDNVLRSTSQIKVESPDLVITDFAVPDTLIAGKRYPVSWTLQNNGARIEKRYVWDRITLSNMNGDAVHELGISHNLNLQPGESFTATGEIYVPALSENGEYTLSVKANADGRLPEKNSENNQSALNPTRYERYEFDEKNNPIIIDIEDLSIRTDCNFSEFVTSKDYLVYWNVENKGDGTCTDWTTYLYISKENVFNIYNSHRLSSVSGTSLEKGDMYSGEVSVSIPDKYYEMKYMYLVVKIQGWESDANDADNVVMIPLNTVLAPTPDLKIKNLNIPVLIAGKNATVTYEVENIGAGETHISEWQDAVYLTTSTSFNKGSYLGEKEIQKILKPGDVYKESIQFKVPTDYNGNYSFYLKVDNGDVIYELENKSDNIGQSFVDVISPTLTPSDLTVKQVSVPASYTVGDQVKFSWVIQNGELYTAVGKLKDAIYLSEDKEWDSSDLLVGTVSEDVVIQPGQTVERTATGVINTAVSGSYYVIIRTNQLNAIKETDYENNVAVATTVCRIDFRELSVGGKASMSGQGFYKLAAQAGETLLLHLEADGTEKGFNLYVAHDRVATVTEYDYSSAQPNDPYQEILIPAMKSGTYYILAQQQEMVSGVENNFTLDGGTSGPARMNLTLSAQLLQFGISSINKAEGGNNGSATSAIMGAKFDSIMDYRLVRNGKVLPAEAVYFQHSSESLVTFNLNEISTGTYDVVIEKNGGVKTEMKSGYTVVTDAPNKLRTAIIASSSMRFGTKNPITIEYSNDGLSDVAVSEFLLVSENGYPLALTSKELEKGETELHIPMIEPGTNKPASIAPGEKGTITIYVHATSMGSISLKLYIVQ